MLCMMIFDLLNRVILFYIFICNIYQCIELYLFLWQFQRVVLRWVNSLFWKWLPLALSATLFLITPFAHESVPDAHFLIWTCDQRLQERPASSGRSYVLREKINPLFLFIFIFWLKDYSIIRSSPNLSHFLIDYFFQFLIIYL